MLWWTTLLLLGVAVNGVWIPIQLEEKITFDKDTSTIELKTNSKEGSGDGIRLYYYDNSNNYAAAFLFNFSDMKYQIGWCSQAWTPLPRAAEVFSGMGDSIWSITRTTHGMQVSINGVMILDVVMSEGLCRREYDWESKYQKIVSKFAFGVKTSESFVYQLTERSPGDQFVSAFALVDEAGNRVEEGEEGLLLYNLGTVCDDRFTDDAAHSICRDMGFGAADGWSSGSKYEVQGKYDIKLDDVTCAEGSRAWSTCTFATSNNCVHVEDIHLTCSASGRLVDHGKLVRFNPEIETIDLKTKTQGNVQLIFVNSAGHHSGSFLLKFDGATPQYQFGWCSPAWLNVPSEMAKEQHTSWHIQYTPSTRHMMVYSNGVALLDVKLSGVVCTNSNHDWNAIWRSDITHIKFFQDDTATRYYKLTVKTPLLHPTSATMSSTYSTAVARYAVDGVIIRGAAAHSMCSDNREWLKIKLESHSCVEAVRVYQQKVNSYKVRMDGAQVAVIDSTTGDRSVCGRLDITDILTLEGQTYTLPCGLACGDEIELSVHKTGGCIHILEMEVFGVKMDHSDTEFVLVDAAGQIVPPNQGAGLLLYRGTTVCDDKFSDRAAHAICKRMGYSRAVTWRNGVGWSIQFEYEIGLTDVVCNTEEWKWCGHSGEVASCAHIEDVMLVCQPGE